ncbi:MAG: GDSL-type esterase/lipase family protein [Bryobacteraceae bacterium]
MIRNVVAAGLALGLALATHAQPPQPSPAVIPPQDLVTMCQRLTTLMDAGGVSVPDLQRAAAPVMESTRQSCIQLQLRPNRSEPTYALYSNLRAYLALADAVPKPFPFPEAAQKQFAELRDASTRLDLHFRALLDFNDRRLISPDPANLARYAEANRRAGTPDAAKPRVVFFGDSITDFWRLNEYFPETDYINRGIAGQTTGDLLQRMKPDVLDLRPQAVVILAGTNDLARGIVPDTVERNYAVMADLAAANKIKVLFASVLPVSDYHKGQNPANERTPGRPPAYILQLNDWLKDFSAKHNATYVDYFPAMADGSGFFQAELSDDGLHPNNKGYRLMAPIALAAIQKTVAPPPPDLQKPKKRGFPSILGSKSGQ